MFDTKKPLIVVYKDELLINQLKKLVETHDDKEDEVVGTRDDSINIVSWTEKVWLGNKKAGNIQGKILFLGGDIKGTDKLIPVLDLHFDESGVKFGWAGNQAVLYANTEELSDREEYDEFLCKLNDMPIPDFLKGDIEDEEEDVEDEDTTVEIYDEFFHIKQNEAEEKEKRMGFLKIPRRILSSGERAIKKAGNQIAEKSEEVFRNKTLMKRQMLIYGIVKLYEDGLEQFMNQ